MPTEQEIESAKQVLAEAAKERTVKELALQSAFSELDSKDLVKYKMAQLSHSTAAEQLALATWYRIRTSMNWSTVKGVAIDSGVSTFLSQLTSLYPFLSELA